MTPPHPTRRFCRVGGNRGIKAFLAFGIGLAALVAVSGVSLAVAAGASGLRATDEAGRNHQAKLADARLQLVGAIRVASTVEARLRPEPPKDASATVTYQWSICDWTGGSCVARGSGRSYRLPAAALGHTLRVSATQHPTGAPITYGPTKVVIPANGQPVVAAAGDIACDPTSSTFKGGVGTSKSCQQAAVSDLVLAQQPTAVLTLGDTQYECGDASAFAASFAPSWGRMKSLIHPAIGNHEYGKACHRNDPAPYFDYFGESAGANGWYSYQVGAWHLIALNSECSYGEGVRTVGGCSSGSAQYAWLRRDLAAHKNACTLAYWHEPRFSSGEHGDAMQMASIWNELVRAKVDIVLSGHNHDYERFDPIGQTPENQTQPNLDPTGIREFVVGTGGRSLYRFTSAALTGESMRSNAAFGTLALTLLPTRAYRWQFIPVPGSGPGDQGSSLCH